MKEILADQLKALLDSGNTPVLLDVREDWECGICRIGGAINIPMQEIPSRIAELNPNSPIVAICHHGMRSQNVAMYLENNGFTDITNLVGGIDAWARSIDDTMATY